MSELDGFVLFANDTAEIRLSISSNSLRVSVAALDLIGSPKYLNIFFDDNRKRLAIKSAEKTTPNAFGLRKAGLARPAAVIEHVLQLLGRGPIEPGETLRFLGKKCGSDYVVFDLGHARRMMCNADASRFKRKKEAAQ